MGIGEIISMIFTGICVIIFLNGKYKIENELKVVREVNNTMKSYMDIFKINEVKEYVELQGKNYALKAVELLRDDKIMNEIVNESIENYNKAQFRLLEDLNEEYVELLSFTCNVVFQNKDDKDNLDKILKTMPLTSNQIKKIIKDKSGIDLSV